MRADEAHRKPDARIGWAAFILVAMGLVLGSLGLYRYRAHQEQTKQHQLIAAIGSLNLKLITNWREERLSNVLRMVKGPLFRWRTEELQRDPRSLSTRDELRQVLQVSKSSRRYQNAILVSLDGQVLMTTDPVQQPFDPATQRVIAAVQTGPECLFSDFFRAADGTTLIDVAALVRGAKDQPMAVAILRIDAETSLFSQFKRWPIPTQTAEAALVLRSGDEAIVPHQLRHEKAGSTWWHRPLTDTSLPAVKAVLGQKGMHESVDYRGRTVLADLQPIPDSPWFLVTKLDEDEALVQLRQESVLITFITLALILLTGTTMAVQFRRREAETFRTLYEQEQSLRASQQEGLRQATALEASEQRFRDLVDSTDGIVWEADATTFAFTYVSQNAERLLGYTTADWLQPTFWADHLHPQDREHAITHCVACTGRLQDHDFEYRFLAKDGHAIWLRDIVRVVAEGGKPRWLRGLMIDITAQKQAEEERLFLQAQLQQSQKMESLGSLAGGVAHDMNNVLGAILGLASANLSIQPPDSPTHRAFETITKAATRGAKMVQGLLTFARQNPADTSKLDVNALLREEVHLLERTTLSMVSLQLDLDPGLRSIRGDASALSHAFLNLCVNAVDAMPERGTITLRTRNIDPGWVEVTIEDTGCGMPKATLDRAMDPFFTTKEQGKGTGLGLSMVYSTVKAHQGTLTIHSEPQRGTRVTMRLPASEALPKPVPQNDPAGLMKAQRGLSVLLIDDDELIQESMLGLLEILGHAPTCAASGEAALTLLEEGFKPDIVILDMNMPGLGGPGTLPRLRAICPELPVILATGRTDQAALDLVKAHPKVALLLKPFEIDALRHQFEALHLI